MDHKYEPSLINLHEAISPRLALVEDLNFLEMKYNKGKKKMKKMKNMADKISRKFLSRRRFKIHVNTKPNIVNATNTLNLN